MRLASAALSAVLALGPALPPALGAGDAAAPESRAGAPMRIGYFHGGRTVLMLRAYAAGDFDAHGAPVELYAAELRSGDYKVVPRSIKKFNERGLERVGKSKGTELIDGIMAGKFDLAMVGESSFLYSLHAGKPVVAIAELGHDVRGHAGHAFAVRAGQSADKPSDYFGKVYISRRAGPGDAIFLREYFERAGLDLKKDVLFLKSLPKSPGEKARLPKNKALLVEDVYEDLIADGIGNGVIDGGYFHLMNLQNMLGKFRLVKSLDHFGDPELSHALLVCRRDFLNANRRALTALLEAYVKRIRYEHGLSQAERTRPQPKGLQPAVNFHGLNYPQYDRVPTVSAPLLYGVEKLLEKHGFIKEKKVRLEDYIDNTLVVDALKQAGVDPNGNYPLPEY